VCIDESTQPEDIAASFRNHYARVFVDSSSEKSKVQEYNEQRLKYTEKYESPDTCILIEDVEYAVKQSKINKAAGIDGLVVQHIYTVTHVYMCT